MKKQVFLIVGTPGSGKTWVCKQLQNEFTYLPHDIHPNVKSYLATIVRAFKQATKPMLIETPFSVSQVTEALLAHGILVTPVFIIETPEVTTRRYEAREGKAIVQGHLTRIETYAKRALELNAFFGTSDEVLNHLKGIL